MNKCSWELGGVHPMPIVASSHECPAGTLCLKHSWVDLHEGHLQMQAVREGQLQHGKNGGILHNPRGKFGTMVG